MVPRVCFNETAAEGIWLPSVLEGCYVVRVQSFRELLQLPVLDRLSCTPAKAQMWFLFLELESGRPGRGEGKQAGDTDCNTVQHPKQ